MKHYVQAFLYQKYIALGAIGGSFISVNNPKIPAWSYESEEADNHWVTFLFCKYSQK